MFCAVRPQMMQHAGALLPSLDPSADACLQTDDQWKEAMNREQDQGAGGGCRWRFSHHHMLTAWSVTLGEGGVLHARLLAGTHRGLQVHTFQGYIGLRALFI